MTRRTTIFAGWLLLLASAVFAAEEAGGVEVGKNVPGSFQPFNVNVAVPISEEPEPAVEEKGPKEKKYTSRGKFHCLITEYDLDPVVFLVARGIDDNAAFRDLLSKIDAALDRNKVSRLRCFVVFLSDDATFNVIKDDDKRDEMVKKLEQLVTDVKLKRLVVTVAGKSDLARYKLDDSTALTAILYKRFKVLAIHKLDKDKLTAANGPETKAILADIGTKLGANR